MVISLLGTIRFEYPYHAPKPVMVISLLAPLSASSLGTTINYLLTSPRHTMSSLNRRHLKRHCKGSRLFVGQEVWGFLLDDELCIGQKYAGTIVKKNIYGFGISDHIWRVDWVDWWISPQDCWPTRSLRPRWRLSKYVCLCHLHPMYDGAILRLIAAYE